MLELVVYDFMYFSEYKVNVVEWCEMAFKVQITLQNWEFLDDSCSLSLHVWG